MAELPVEVITKLLSRLPVKLLLRLRSVSKRWCALIDGQDFVKSHLKNSAERRKLVIGGMSTLRFLNLDDDFAENVVQRFNGAPLAGFTELLGSCNGLVLLRTGDEIWLLNPSIKEHVILPPCPEFDETVKEIYWLGYDFVSDDYKVVRNVELGYLEDGGVRFDTRVYSLKSNSWRKVQDFTYCLPFNTPIAGAFVGGVWHASVLENQKSIVGFDISSESCRLVPLPEGFVDGFGSMHVTVLGGCLCLLGGYIHHRTDVWVMKKYGVRESWTKLFSIAPPTVRPYFSVVPLVYSSNGCEVLLNYENRKLIWFDWRNKAVRDAPARHLPGNFYACVFMESLVRLRRIDVPKKQLVQVKEKGNEGKKKSDADGFLSVGFNAKALGLSPSKNKNLYVPKRG